MAAAATTGAREEERQREREVPLLYVLALSVALPLPIAVSRMDAGVPRKARTIWNWPRAKPTGWWAFRLPVPLVKEARPPRPKRQRMRSGLGAPDLAAAPAVERPAKKAKRCVQCGTSETPQWRSGPMGRSTLCNSCGVRLRASGALRGKVRRPPPPPVSYKAASPPPPPPDSPASDSPPDSPICVCRVPPGDVYLVRKQPKRETGTPGKEEAAPPPSPSPEPATHLVKKNKKKPSRPRNTGQRCLHCGTTSTPQWRSGPMGRHTLCNACGVRYRQGRLLPEYRPATSPTFVPSKHASRHREVLQLHRRRRQQDKSRQLAKRPSSDDGLLPDLRAGDDDPNNVFLLRRQRPDKEPYPPTPPHRPLPPQPRPVDGNNNNDGAVLAGCSCGDNQTPGGSLDSLLLDGPSAPLIVDESLVR